MDFLDALSQRVIVYDGATGTSLQRANLTEDDFGGPEFAGCNELLNATRPDVIGLNCATGPQEMDESLRYLARHTRIPISVIPNAGLPELRGGEMYYDLTPDELAG